MWRIWWMKLLVISNKHWHTAWFALMRSEQRWKQHFWPPFLLIFFWCFKAKLILPAFFLHFVEVFLLITLSFFLFLLYCMILPNILLCIPLFLAASILSYSFQHSFLPSFLAFFEILFLLSSFLPLFFLSFFLLDFFFLIFLPSFLPFLPFFPSTFFLSFLFLPFFRCAFLLSFFLPSFP